MTEILNVKITSVTISMRDHGCLTFGVTVEGAGFGCTIGGYAIGHGYLGAEQFDATDAGLVAIMKIMDTVGVERWEDLKGQYARIKTEGWGSRITCIGNILKNKWFDLKEFFAEKKEGDK